MKYLFDVGSSTIKMYEYESEKLRLIRTQTFSFKDQFYPSHELSSQNYSNLINFFNSAASDYELLDKTNTKIFATGIFRELSNRQDFIEDFYSRTKLYFNIVSHDLEEYYLETAWTDRCDSDLPFMVINIGGKTTELVFYQNRKIVARELLQIGVGTVISQYDGINDELSRCSLEKITTDIRSSLPHTSNRCYFAIYTGGELNYMKLAEYALEDNKLFADDAHPSMITLSKYVENNRSIFQDVSLKDLKALMPDNPSWMNGARACSALAQAICQHYSVNVVVPSDSNLVDGVVLREAKDVVLCGSFNRHLDKIENISSSLSSLGINVLSPGNTNVSGSINGFLLFEDDKIINNCTWSVESLHLKAIDNSDAVIVCNFENYVGTKTALEVGYAYKCGKRIIFLNDGESVSDFDVPCEVGLLKLSPETGFTLTTP
jgi:hypothetical protein